MKNGKYTDDNFVRFLAVDLNGDVYDVTADNHRECPLPGDSIESYSLLKQFMANELEKAPPSGHSPKHINFMQKHDLVDYCRVSEKGHLKWLPKGLLIQKLLLDYAENLAYQWGAFAMKNPIIIKGDQNEIGELMGEFHERDYKVDGGRGPCYLRYASDPLAFPFMQKVHFSHRQSPLKVYEEANCFRNEQQGEVSGLKRVRNFTMTDMHAACASEDEAKKEFVSLCHLFAGLMDNIIARGRWVLGWEGTLSFFDENQSWLIDIGKSIGVPAFFKLMPEMSHYYTIKNEFQAIAEDNSNIQISTVQWDIKDGERFDIGYIDETGKKHPCPVIIHASSFGSIERALCAILENIAVDMTKGNKPLFPGWLAPTHLRVIPVTKSQDDMANMVCKQISLQEIRVDIDDRNETLGRRIRDAEKEWVPYVAVIGQNEMANRRVAVRERGEGRVIDTDISQLACRIKAGIGASGMPFRQLFLPVHLSQRPVFKR